MNTVFGLRSIVIRDYYALQILHLFDLWRFIRIPEEKHCLRLPRFRQFQNVLNRSLREQRTAHPDPAQTFGVRGEEQLHPGACHGLHRHPEFRLLSLFIGIHIHIAHVQIEEDEEGRGSYPLAGTRDSLLDFLGWESVVFEVALEFDCHRVREFLLDGRRRHHAKPPRLTVVGGGGEGRSGEDLPDDGLRHRVRFEASNRAAGPQEVVQVSCAGRSGSA